MNMRWVLLFLLMFAVVMTRLLPHPNNFSPIMALALFSGVICSQKKLAMMIPLLAMLISDFFVGFHSLIWVVYGCFALVAYMGHRAESQKSGEKLSLLSLVGLGLWGSVLFFVVTNFAVWAQTAMYPKTWEGLIACFMAAVPFFKNSLGGNALFMFTLFGAWSFIEGRSRATKEAKVSAD